MIREKVDIVHGHQTTSTLAHESMFHARHLGYRVRVGVCIYCHTLISWPALVRETCSCALGDVCLRTCEKFPCYSLFATVTSPWGSSRNAKRCLSSFADRCHLVNTKPWLPELWGNFFFRCRMLVRRRSFTRTIPCSASRMLLASTSTRFLSSS